MYAQANMGHPSRTKDHGWKMNSVKSGLRQLMRTGERKRDLSTACAPVPRHAGAGEMTSLWRTRFYISRRGSRNCRSVGFPDFLSRVVASVNCMWFSLGRTTKVALVRAVK
jgi:hypothetical protein